MRIQRIIGVFCKAQASKYFIFLSLSILWIWGGTGIAMAQNSPLQVVFQKDTLFEKTGGIGVSILEIRNTSTTDQTFNVAFEKNPNYRFLNKPMPEYELEPGGSLVVPVRVYLIRELKGGKILDLDVKINSISNSWPTISASGKIKIIENSTIYVYPLNDKVYYYKNQNFAMLQLQVENRGNVDAELKLEFQTGKGYTSNQNRKVNYIAAGTDTIIYISLKPTNEKKSTLYGNTQLSIVVRNRKNKIINVVNFEVVPVTSIKRFSDPTSENSNPNTITLWGNGYGTNFIYYNVAANGNVRFKDASRFNYRVQSLYFNNNQRFFVRNILLNYAKGKYKIGVGDQTEFFEKNLFGRGVRGEVKTASGSFSGLVLFNQYKSFQGDKENVEILTSIMGKHKYNLDQQNTITSAIIQQFDGQTKTNSSLLVSEYEVRPSKKDYLKIRGGVGTEQFYGDRNNLRTTFGAGTGLDYVKNIRKVDLKSINFFSTPSYAATRRGEIQLSEQIFYNYSTKQVFGGGLLIRKSDPNLFFNGQPVKNIFQFNQNYELFYSLSTKTNLIIFKPSYRTQTLDFFSTESYRALTEIKSQKERGISYFLSTDAGYVKPISTPGKFLFTTQIKNNLNYNQFGLSSLVNVGPYYIFEQYLYSVTGKYPVNLNVSPHANLAFLENKLTVLVLGNYFIDNVQKIGRRSIGTTFNYILPSNYSVSLKTEWLSSKLFNRVEVKVGVRKNFNKIRLKSHTLKVVLFADSNGNWIQDANEPVKVGAIVSVNQLSFITDKNGEILYKQLPDGEYQISIVDGLGWYLPVGYQTNYIVRQNKEVVLPLINGVGLSGKVIITKVRYSKEKAIKIGGIKITATDPKGKVYETLTSSQGDFNFYLPLNTYDLKIYKNALGPNFEFINESLQINLNEENRGPAIFEIKEKSRRLKVKKFNASGDLVEKNFNEIATRDTLILLHEVEARETMEQIALKYNMKIDDLIRMNNLKWKKISFGQKLKVYYFYELNNIIAYPVKSGDDIYSVAKQFKMTPEELMALNKLNSYSINKGQVIKVVKKR